MKKIVSAFPYLLFAVAVFYLLYQKGYILKNYEDISVEKASYQLSTDTNITLVDVRTEKEVQKEGKIRGALLLPLQSLKKDLHKLMPYKDKKIFVYCRSGNRSIAASRILSHAGFKVYNIKGGILEWKKRKPDWVEFPAAQR